MIYINNPNLPYRRVWGIDIETTDLSEHSGKLLSVALSDGKDVWIYLDYYGFESVKPILENGSIRKIAHNASFESRWFLKYLNAVMYPVWDTMLVEHQFYLGKFKRVMDAPVALDAVVAKYFGIFMDKYTREEFQDHPGFAILPPTEKQIEYMANDVLYLPKLHELQIEQLSELGLLEIAKLENACVPATAELEHYGKVLDVALWAEQLEQFDMLLEKYDAQMRKAIGNFSFEIPAVKDKIPYTKEVAVEDINFRSYPHKIGIFTQRFNIATKTSDANFVEAQLAKTPKGTEYHNFLYALSEYNKWNKRKGFDYAKFIHPNTGRVHASYHQTGTVTARYSCSKPNLQQCPRPTSKDEPNMRNIWVADNENYVIIRIDYSQQEPRIFAYMSKDEAMIKACNEKDVYIAYGRHLYGKEIEKGSEERFIVKTFVLATNYGSGDETLAAQSGKSVKECAKVKQMIKQAFPIAAKFGKKANSMAQMYGFVTSAWGRRRYFEGKVPYTEAVNSPIQATGADMFKLALAKIWKSLTELKKTGKLDSNTRVWHVLHDEIEVMCHKDEVDIVLPLIKTLMEEAGNEMCPGVLHVAEAEVGYRWDK